MNEIPTKSGGMARGVEELVPTVKALGVVIVTLVIVVFVVTQFGNALPASSLAYNIFSNMLIGVNYAISLLWQPIVIVVFIAGLVILARYMGFF